MTDYSRYLAELLKEEAESARAEVQALRSSLRYRAGAIVLEAFPPSLHSLALLPRMVRLYATHWRSRRKRSHFTHAVLTLSREAVAAKRLVFGNTPSQAADMWVTSDALQLAQRIDRNAPVLELTLRLAHPVILRRLARLREQGCRVLWCPEPGIDHDPALMAYVVAQADECFAEWEA